MSNTEPTQAAPVPAADAADPQTSAPSADTTDKDETADEGQPAKKQLTPEERRKFATDRRIAGLVNENRRLREAERVNQAELAKYKPKTDGPPREEDFEEEADFLKAVGKYEAKQEQKAEKDEQDKAAKAKSVETRRAEAEAAYEKKAEEFTKTNPGFRQAEDAFSRHFDMVDERNPVLQVISSAIIEDDNAHAIIQHLGNNPEVFDEILEMTPYQAVRALAKLDFGTLAEAGGAVDEEEGDSRPAPQIRNVKAPLAPVGSGGRSSATKDEDSMSAKDWVEMRNKQIAAKNRR